MKNSFLAVPAEPAPRETNLHLFYRARVTLPAGFTDPVLRFYATGETEIALNGASIHYGPGRSEAPLLYYDELIPEVKAGENLFTFHLGCDRNPGLLAELEVTIDGERRLFLGGPADFEAAYFTGYAGDAPRNAGTGYAEYVTLAAGEGEWRSGRFPHACPAARSAAEAIPKEYWRPRSIPLFHEVERLPETVADEGESLLLDFGILRFGRAELRGVATGPVTVEYIEDLKGGWSSPRGTQVMYDDRILDASGPFYWKGHRKRAGRYVRLRGVKREGLCFRFLEYGYPLRELGSFHSSDAFLNRLTRIGIETLKPCMEDIYTDCPHRDQQQWMDAFASAQAALGIFGVRDLTRKCLLQYGFGQREDGQFISPSLGGGEAVPDYTLLLFPFLHWYYRVTGDREVVAELYDNLGTALAGFRRLEAADGLLDLDGIPNGFIYFDNTFELAKRGKSAILNALYFRALKDYSSFSKLLGKDNQAEERAEALRETWLRSFRHPTRPGCFRDNAVIYDRGFRMVNFSCELGHWEGKLPGILEFKLSADRDEIRKLEVADYAGFRVLVNGELALDRPRPRPTWGREPMYAPETIELPLKKGVNHIRFEVASNALNWELFLRGENFDPFDTRVGEGEALRPFRLRSWVPPELSQSTHGYAAFAGLLHNQEETLAMLRQTLADEYPRTYRSVRVPSFCPEAGEEREKEPWIMPCNTPWPTYFFLSGLFGNGGVKEGLQVIRSYWRDMVADGATTAYEEWGTRSSLCHAWGASPILFFHRELLGVRQETLYTGVLTVRPNLGDLEFVEGRVAVDSERMVEVRLCREGEGTRVQINAPHDLPIRLDLTGVTNPRLAPESNFTDARRELQPVN